MRIVLQRVERASVRVEGELVAQIGRGVLALVGIQDGDGAETVVAAAGKMAGLRLFADQAGKMNLDAAGVHGAFLIVSQFTLASSLEKGRRPSFDGAAPPAVAQPLVEQLVLELRRQGFEVAAGRFGAHMAVELVNDGPVTFVLDLSARGASAGVPA